MVYRGRASQKKAPTLGPLVSFNFTSQATRPQPPFLAP